MASSSWVALTTPLAPSGSSRIAGESASSSAIYTYLDRLPAPTLARLYASPSSALAILRLLPVLARHLVMNLLWIDHLAMVDLELWFSRRSEGKRCAFMLQILSVSRSSMIFIRMTCSLPMFLKRKANGPRSPGFVSPSHSRPGTR